jgi:hypothetical protein
MPGPAQDLKCMQWQGSCPSCRVSDLAVASKLATALGLTLRENRRTASLERGVLRFQALVVHDSKSSSGKSFSVGVLVKSTRGFAGTSWANALVRLKNKRGFVKRGVLGSCSSGDVARLFITLRVRRCNIDRLSEANHRVSVRAKVERKEC